VWCSSVSVSQLGASLPRELALILQLAQLLPLSARPGFSRNMERLRGC
jgi:hypothetical protein